MYTLYRITGSFRGFSTPFSCVTILVNFAGCISRGRSEVGHETVYPSDFSTQRFLACTLLDGKSVVRKVAQAENIGRLIPLLKGNAGQRWY